MKSSNVISIAPSKQGGSIATSSGKVLENMVMSSLITKGLDVVMYREWEKSPDKYSDELLLKNAPYVTLYGHSGNTEFLVKSARYNIQTRIECKWQQAKGSVDEKFPYLFLNCVQQMSDPHIIILHDGGGAKEGAVQWLKNVCEEYTEREKASSGRVIEVMDISYFTRWVNQIFK
jgi:hypothetical protein